MRYKFIAPFILALVVVSGCATSERRLHSGVDITPADMVYGEERAGRLKDLAPQELLARAEKYARQGNLQMAEIHYVSLLGKEPESVPGLLGLAMTSYKQNQLVRARNLLEMGLKVEPDNHSLLLLKGKIERHSGMFDESYETLLRASELSPEDSSTLQELAITLEAMGSYAEAEELFLTALRLTPESAAANNNIGFYYLMRGDYKNAVSRLEEGVRFNPDNKRMRNNLAVAYAMMGDDSKAMLLFTETLGKAAAYNNVGYLRMVRGELDGSRKALEMALDLSPKLYEKALANRDRLFSEQNKKSVEATQGR